MSHLCAIASVVIACASSVQDEKAEKELRTLLPIKEVQADIMAVVWPARYAELAEKFQQAAKQNGEWLVEYTKSAEPGKPLPYHPKLGLTKAEYEEMLELNDKFILRKEGTTKLTIREQSDKSISFSAEPQISPLGEVRINPSRGSITTPYGKGESFSAIHTPEKHPFAWDGYGWVCGEDLDPTKGRGSIIRFNVGKLRSSGKTILTYSATGIHQGRPIEPFEIILSIDNLPSTGNPKAPDPSKEARPKEEPLSNDEVEQRFIRAKIVVARELLKKGTRDKAIEVLEDIIKSYPRHSSTIEAKKLLEELRKQK